MKQLVLLITVGVLAFAAVPLIMFSGYHAGRTALGIGKGTFGAYMDITRWEAVVLVGETPTTTTAITVEPRLGEGGRYEWESIEYEREIVSMTETMHIWFALFQIPLTALFVGGAVWRWNVWQGSRRLRASESSQSRKE